jgi:hypothetical protein
MPTDDANWRAECDASHRLVMASEAARRAAIAIPYVRDRYSLRVQSPVLRGLDYAIVVPGPFEVLYDIPGLGVALRMLCAFQQGFCEGSPEAYGLRWSQKWQLHLDSLGALINDQMKPRRMERF